jgi:hypothetical protein
MLRVVCPGRWCNGIQLFWPRRLIAAESQKKVGWNPGQVLAKPSSFLLPPSVFLSLSLTRTRRQDSCYQNAQFFPDSGLVHREPMNSPLSVNASYLPKILCISIATHETYFAHGETFNHRFIVSLSACNSHYVRIILYEVSSEPCGKEHRPALGFP